MNNKNKVFGFVLFSILGIFTLQAQETIPVSGGNALGSGGSVSYTIGQSFYTTSFGTNGSVAQGVQQPFEISVVAGIEQDSFISLQCAAFPNPTDGFLKLKFEDSPSYNIASMSYQLFDMDGKLIEAKKISNLETNINMENLIPATYFLKVIQTSKEIKIFKIIKN